MRAQARGNHPAVVGHQQIFRSQKRTNFAKSTVMNAPDARSNTSSLLLSRGSAGCWAMKLFGSSYSKRSVRIGNLHIAFC